MKKSKGKWTKKRGGFLGFSVPDFGISSFFGYTKPDTPATGTTQASGTSSVTNQTATGTNSVTTSGTTGAKQATQSTGATQSNNTVGGSRRKRKTKKSKK